MLTETEYQAKLQRLRELMASDPEPYTQAARELLSVGAMVGSYERAVSGISSNESVTFATRFERRLRESMKSEGSISFAQPPQPVGAYWLGGVGTGYGFCLNKRPRWFTRWMMRVVFEWEWKDN